MKFIALLILHTTHQCKYHKPTYLLGRTFSEQILRKKCVRLSFAAIIYYIDMCTYPFYKNYTLKL